jgi:hypothetical protein
MARMKRSLAILALAAVVACESEHPAGVPPTAPPAAGDAAPAAAPAGGDSAPADNGAPAAAGAQAAAGDGAATGTPAGTAPVAPAAKAERRFLEVTGNVTFDGKAATVDMEIPETGKVVTGTDGYALITLGAGSLIELRANTTVDLGTSARKKTSLKLALGTIWSILPTGSSYEVETPKGVAGVRGTIFFVEETPDELYICDCDGQVDVQTAKAKKPNQLTSKHQHKGVAVVGGIQRKAKLKDHTDEQVAKLLTMVPGGTDKKME